MTDPRPVCTEKTQDIIKALRSNAQVEAALELAVKQQEKRIADQIILTETPAPPFHEEERAKVLLGMFKQYGLTDVKQDAIGNVIGRKKGTGNGPTLVVSHRHCFPGRNRLQSSQRRRYLQRTRNLG